MVNNQVNPYAAFRGTISTKQDFPRPGENALHQKQAIPHYYNNNNNNNNDRLTAFDPGQPG